MATVQIYLVLDVVDLHQANQAFLIEVLLLQSVLHFLWGHLEDLCQFIELVPSLLFLLLVLGFEFLLFFLVKIVEKRNALIL